MQSQQVLALKWRPRNFTEMIGQTHVLPALINALDQNRLHHAYLFSGTRGVGKTSVARILAKCLNCETGVSSTPCNTCSTCTAIDAGRFIDLIEVDAASRTKVEDTRELLDNVQYTPSQGRFKIYLIDEVHMLSSHSFNALLKTLEEPPPHVKFLLATTDPQRLPVTVLSRCLQFNLKHISAPELVKHFAHILKQENIEADGKALSLLSEAAKGSVRDGLSLVDQAIAHCQNHITADKIHAMLGSLDQTRIEQLITALADGQAETLLDIVDTIAEHTGDFKQVLDALLSALHTIALAQFVPGSTQNPVILECAKKLSQETVQLYYQIALIGQRDLPLASTPKAGFEMVLLRMLAFETAVISDQKPQKRSSKDQVSPVETKSAPKELKDWTNIVNQLQLSGMALALASHCTLQAFDGTELELLLSIKHQPILTNKLKDRLAAALSSYFDKPITLKVIVGDTGNGTPAEQKKEQQATALKDASEHISSDAHVQQLMETFDAEIKPGSISPPNNPAETVT